MSEGLVVGFGNLIGPPLLEELKTLGIKTVLSDYLHVTKPEDLPILISEVEEVGLLPLSIIRPEQVAWLPEGHPLDVIIWNEPDLGTWPTPRMTPEEYAAEVVDAYHSRSYPHKLWAGVISNLDADSLDWLKKSIPRWPSDVGVAVHRYPPNGGTPSTPHKGFKSREHEVEVLERIAPTAEFLMSEFGYHRANQSTGWGPWKKTWRWTPEQQAEFTQQEFEFWREHCFMHAIAYQINSGPGSGYLDHFGWRDLSGNWLPVSQSIRRML